MSLPIEEMRYVLYEQAYVPEAKDMTDQEVEFVYKHYPLIFGYELEGERLPFVELRPADEESVRVIAKEVWSRIQERVQLVDQVRRHLREIEEAQAKIEREGEVAIQLMARLKQEPADTEEIPDDKSQLLEKMFREAMAAKSLIAFPNEHMRQTGKTKLLIDTAKETGATIIVGSVQAERYIREHDSDVKVEFLFPTEIRGRRYPHGVLIEENVSKEVIAEFRRNNIDVIGGFLGLYY